MEVVQKCLTFINESVSCFHVIENMEKQLLENDFVKLEENQDWQLNKGKSYFVKRNDSSLIAFRIPEKEIKGYHIVASHSDSPTFKLKTKAQMRAEGGYVKLNVEPYGGMIHATWLDRCLSVAGRITYRKDGVIQSKTVNIDEDLLVIPNLAIHMNREMNKNLSYNPQIDLLPLLCADYEGVELSKEEMAGDLLLEKLSAYGQIPKEEILGSDLFLYVREKGKLAGAKKDLVVAPRLDDLECVYASLCGIIESEPENYITVCAVFDNEEVGSLTRQGAASTFMKNVFERIEAALSVSRQEALKWYADSFMISADNAHACHPNHPEKADPTDRPYLNGGIVIKYHGGQKYTTDAYSEAVMKQICMEAEVSYQTYANRSDVTGGSTLGNLSQAQIAVPCVDIGLPQLAMHSAVETAGSRDIEDLIKALKVFYQR